MRWFKRGERPGTLRPAASPDRKHLEEFARTRRGVEGYVEPRTAVTDTTMVLIAHDGEWTRRRVPDPAAAHALANSLGVPSYDAGLVGYPQRMRDYNARQAALERGRLSPPSGPPTGYPSGPASGAASQDHPGGSDSP